MIPISDRDHAKISCFLRELVRIDGRDNRTINLKREALLLARKMDRQRERLNPEERKEQKIGISTSRVAIGNDGQRTLFAQEP